jgi:DNA repair protein RadC
MKSKREQVMRESAAPDAAEPKAYRVCDMPERLRPREEMERRGVQNISDAALLAILIRTGLPGLNAVQIAERLMHEHRSLTGLAQAPLAALEKAAGMGPVKAQVLKAALELGRRLTEEAVPVRASVRSPAQVAAVLREEARTLDRECFWVLLLDVKNRLVKDPVEVSLGLLDTCPAHPREVFREAILSSSANVILAHNHPSGDPAPSAEDIRLTKQLVNAGRTVGIPVLDHVILGRLRNPGGEDFASLRESGAVSFTE